MLTVQVYSPASVDSIEPRSAVLVYLVKEVASGGVDDARLWPFGVVHTVLIGSA